MSQINNVLQPLCGDFERITQILPCYLVKSNRGFIRCNLRKISVIESPCAARICEICEICGRKMKGGKLKSTNKVLKEK